MMRYHWAQEIPHGRLRQEAAMLLKCRLSMIQRKRLRVFLAFQATQHKRVFVTSRDEICELRTPIVIHCGIFPVLGGEMVFPHYAPNR